MRKFAQTTELIDKVLQNKGLELQVCCRAPTNEVYCLVIKDPGRPSASMRAGQETPVPCLTLVLLMVWSLARKGIGHKPV
jgi:hypothetical protein